jgi:UDP-glucose 4-epimerase
VKFDLGASFAGKHVLITGGLGFIGSNLAHRLVGLGAEVTLVDFLLPGHGGNLHNIDEIEERIQLIVTDVRNKLRMSQVIPGQDFLFNLAGQVSHLGSIRDPLSDLEFNCSGHVGMLELCRKLNPGVKIINSGTRQIYGRPRYLPVDENHPIEPTDFNGISNMAGEWYYILYHRIFGMRTTSLRMTNVYGPRMWVKDEGHTFIGWWFRQLLEREELQIFGDGKQIRDLNYIDDVVDALLISAVDPCADGQVYNLGGNEPIGLLDLARLMVELNGSGAYRLVDFPIERKRIDIGDYIGDYTKIHTQLGWSPQVSLRAGIARALDFYRQRHKYYW